MKLSYLPSVIGALGILSIAGTAGAQDLIDLSLEDLLAQQVTSVAKRPQNVQESPAAVFVIGREDIRRSGATTLPELLRMVPGVEVASLLGHKAAVSARGFNGQFANKLLVLVDGRAIYLSALSGVSWEQQAVPVEDIERIEVVRGPGATLWGANAVNGVINVVTKHAVDSLGGAATAQVDSEGSGRAYLRQGFRIGETGALRLYGVVASKYGEATSEGNAVEDRALAGQIGFRFNAEPNDRDAVTLQGDLQSNRFTPRRRDGVGLTGALNPSGNATNQNLAARWTRTIDEGQSTTLQVYFDRVDLRQGPGLERRLFDVEFSHQFQIGSRHDIVWGLGYRSTENRFEPFTNLTVVSTNQNWYGGFVQDDITVIPERLVLSLGAKLEDNPWTGFEVQPSARAIWTGAAGWSLWGAVSQAARTPSDLEVGVSADFRPLPVVLVVGNTEAERLTAFEVGWRGRINPAATLDLTAFYNLYDGLIGSEGKIVILDRAPVLVFSPANITDAQAYGAEASLDARLKPWWTLKVAASWLKVETDPILTPFTTIGTLGGELSPTTQLSVRSMFDVSDSVDLDLWVRHVDAGHDDRTKSYTNLDLRLAWRPKPDLELSLLGLNLFGDRAPELRTDGVSAFSRPSPYIARRVQISASVRY